MILNTYDRLAESGHYYHLIPDCFVEIRIVPAAGLEPNLLIPRSDPQIPLPTKEINPVIRIFWVSSLH